MRTVEKTKLIHEGYRMCKYLCDLFGEESSNFPDIKIVPYEIYNKNFYVIPKKLRKFYNVGIAGALYNQDDNVIVTLEYRPDLNYISEYKFINNNEIIGAIYSNNKYDQIRVDLSHEIAHWFASYVKKHKEKDHGRYWQIYYAILRTKFVNNRRGVLTGKKAINKALEEE